MEIRDVVASALAAAGVAGIATSSAFLTGKAWVGVLVASVLVLLAAVGLMVAPAEEVAVSAPESAPEPPPRTHRTTAPALGLELEESRQGVVPKIGHAIGQEPEFYVEPLAEPTRENSSQHPFWRRKVRT